MTDSVIKKPEPGELIEAVKRNDIKAAEDLLDRGADANETSEKGDPALLIAIEKSVEFVSLLVERGADPDKENSNGYSPVDSISGALAACYEFGMSGMNQYQEMGKIFQEAPQRHRRFIEKKASEAAAKAAAAARAEQERHEKSIETQQLIKQRASKFRPRPKSGANP